MSGVIRRNGSTGIMKQAWPCTASALNSPKIFFLPSAHLTKGHKNIEFYFFLCYICTLGKQITNLFQSLSEFSIIVQAFAILKKNVK